MKSRLSLIREFLKISVLLLCLIVLCWCYHDTTAFGAPLSGEPSPEDEAEYVPGELLVKLKDGTTSFHDASRMLSAQQLSAASPVPALGIWKVEVPPGQEQKQLQAWQDSPDVEYAELNYIAYAQETPNDPYFYQQWGLDKIDAPEGWDFTHGSDLVIVAIVDTGIDGTHPDLASKVLAGYNFVSSSPIAAHTNSDDNSHGTHVAGIAAAITNNGVGVAGLGWESLLMPVKVLNSGGSGTYANVALGVRYAADNGAQIINMSLGGSASDRTLSEAVDYAYNKGCLLLAASGNYGWSTLLYPARYNNVMGVGRTDSNDQRYWTSNYGDGLNVMAPGSSIYSTVPGNSYGYKSGTSMSCPYASGLAALVWALIPDERNEVQQIIQDHAVDLGDPGWDQYYGYGRIDVLATLQDLFLVVSPPTFTFLADDQTVPIPNSMDLTMRTANAGVITWTMTISPAATTWLTATPGMGSVSASEPATIQIEADKTGLSHDNYECDLLVDFAHSGGVTTTSSIDISLHYVEELSRTYLFPILQDYAY